METNLPRRLSRLHDRERTDYLLMVPKVTKNCLAALDAICKGGSDLDAVPMGSKLRILPGTNMYMYMNNLGDRLHHKDCDFDLTVPPEIYISNTYRCLHDKNLRDYFYTQKFYNKLKNSRYMTNDNKVVCTLKEYHEYRDYLKKLSIAYLNKSYTNFYEQHTPEARALRKDIIQERMRDPENPNNAKVDRARVVREALDRAREIRGRKVLRQAAKDRELRRIREKQSAARKTREEIAREKMREKRIQNKIIRANKEKLMKEEVNKLHGQEEKYRLKQIAEKKRVKILDKERDKALYHEREIRFRLMKLAEYRQMLEEEEERRKINVQIWMDYFNKRAENQRRIIAEALQRDAEWREERNRLIMESLKRRGWNELRHYKPEEYRKRLKKLRTEPTILIDGIKIEVPTRFSTSLVSSATTSSMSIASSNISETTRRDEIALAKSSWLVLKAIELSKSVLLPLLQSYEQRHEIKIEDVEVPYLLKDLYPALQKELTGREELVKNHHYPPAETKFYDFPSTMIFDRKASEPQLLLAEIINELSQRVAYRIIISSFNPQHLKHFRNKLAHRIAALANSVASEIMVYGLTAAQKASSVSETISSISRQTSYSMPTPAEQKLSTLTKILIDEVFGVNSKSDGSSSSDIGSVVREGKKLTKEIAELAHYVAHSAIHVAAVPGDSSMPTEEQFFANIEPMISNLTHRIVTEIMKDRTSKLNRRPVGFAQLENKISTLAQGFVQKVLHGKAPIESSAESSSVSKSSASSEVSEGPSIDDIAEAFSVLQKGPGKTPHIYESLTDNELKRITMRVAKKTTPSSEPFPAILSAILMLASALAEDTLTRHRGPGEPSLSLSIGNALKILAEAVVNSILEDNKRVESLREAGYLSDGTSSSGHTTSRINSAVSALAGTMVQTAILNTGQSDDSSSTGHGTISVVNSAVSELAGTMVSSSINKAGYASDGASSSGNTSSAVNSAVSNLARDVVASTMDKTGYLSDGASSGNTSSAVNSAVSNLAGNVVASTMDKTGYLSDGASSGNTSSAVNSAVSNLAGSVVASTMGKTSHLSDGSSSGNTSSAVNSAVSNLAGSVVASTMGKTSQLSDGASSGNTSSAVNSAVSNLAGSVVASTMGKTSQLSDGASSGNTSSAVNSAVSNLAGSVVASTMDKTSHLSDGASSGNTSSAVNSAVSNLAGSVVASTMGKASHLSDGTSSGNTSSAVNSAVSNLAGNVVASTMNKAGYLSDGTSSSGNTSSAVNSAVSNLAGNVVASSMNKTQYLSDGASSGNTSSAVNSAVSNLAGSVVASTMNKAGHMSDGTSSSGNTSSAVNSAVSNLARNVVASTMNKETGYLSGGGSSSGNTSSAVSSAVSQLAGNMVATTMNKTGQAGLQANVNDLAENIISTLSKHYGETKDSMRNTSSELSSALSELSEQVVISTIKQHFEEAKYGTKSTRNELSCTLSELSEEMVLSAIKQHFEEAKASSRNTSSEISSALGDLSEKMVISIIKQYYQETKDSSRNTSSELSSALTELSEQIVISAIKQHYEETRDSTRNASSELNTALSELPEKAVLAVVKQHYGESKDSSRNTSTELSSVLGELTEKVISVIKQHYGDTKDSSRTTSSELSSALSELSEQVVLSAIKQHYGESKESSRSTSSELSSALSELSERIVISVIKQHCGESSRNTSSELSSALSELSENVVNSAINQHFRDAKDSSRNTSSELSSALSELSEQMVISAIKQRFKEGTSSRNTSSEFSSALSELSEQVIVSVFRQEESNKISIVVTPDGTEVGKGGSSHPCSSSTSRNSLSAFSSAVSDLAANVISFTVEQYENSGRSLGVRSTPQREDLMSRATRNFTEILMFLVEEFASFLDLPTDSLGTRRPKDLEGILRSTVTSVVIDTVVGKIIQQLKVQVNLTSLSKASMAKLKLEVTQVVRSLFVGSGFDPTKKSSSTSVLSRSDRSTISSVASSIAENVLKQLLGEPKIKLKTVSEDASLHSFGGEEEIEVLEVNIDNAIQNFRNNLINIDVEEKTMSGVEAALNAAANKAVATAISTKVIERIHGRTLQNMSPSEEANIKREVTEMVTNMMGQQSLMAEPTLQRKPSVIKKKASGFLSSTSLTTTTEKTTTTTSATSTIANALLQKVFGVLAQKLPQPKEKREMVERKCRGASNKFEHTLSVQGNSSSGYTTEEEFDYMIMPGHYKNSYDRLYHTSFFDWKRHLMDLYGNDAKTANVSENEDDDPEKRRYHGISFLLDGLAKKVIRNVAEKRKLNEQKEDQKKRTEKLVENDMFEIDQTTDTQSLVEDLAIEIVVALLGLEKPVSDPSSLATYGSSSDQKISKIVVPSLSTGHTPFPLIGDENNEKDACAWPFFLERPTTALGNRPLAGSIDFEQGGDLKTYQCDFAKGWNSPGADLAMDHPCRIVSPSTRTKQNCANMRRQIQQHLMKNQPRNFSAEIKMTPLVPRPPKSDSYSHIAVETTKRINRKFQRKFNENQKITAI